MSNKKIETNITNNNILVKDTPNYGKGIVTLRGKLKPTFKETDSVELQHQLATLWHRPTK